MPPNVQILLTRYLVCFRDQTGNGKGRSGLHDLTEAALSFWSGGERESCVLVWLTNRWPLPFVVWCCYLYPEKMYGPFRTNYLMARFQEDIMYFHTHATDKDTSPFDDQDHSGQIDQIDPSFIRSIRSRSCLPGIGWFYHNAPNCVSHECRLHYLAACIVYSTVTYLVS